MISGESSNRFGWACTPERMPDGEKRQKSPRKLFKTARLMGPKAKFAELVAQLNKPEVINKILHTPATNGQI